VQLKTYNSKPITRNFEPIFACCLRLHPADCSTDRRAEPATATNQSEIALDFADRDLGAQYLHFGGDARSHTNMAPNPGGTNRCGFGRSIWVLQRESDTDPNRRTSRYDLCRSIASRILALGGCLRAALLGPDEHPPTADSDRAYGRFDPLRACFLCRHVLDVASEIRTVERLAFAG
jgi:hypothetical protein